MVRRDRLVGVSLAFALLLFAFRGVAVVASPQFGPITLVATPTSVDLGQPVLFTVANVPAINGSLVLNFGDGTAMPISGATTLSHVYPNAGFLTAYITVLGSIVAETSVRVVQPLPQVPIGSAYAASVTVSPVIAGGETTVILNYGLAMGQTGVGLPFPRLEAVIDLLDARGKLLRRSDAVPVFVSTFAGAASRVLQVPYDVPLDASGRYALTISLLTLNGGRVLRSQPIPLRVLPGPDPHAALKSSVRGSGALDIGPATPSRESLNAAITTELQFPTSALGITGTTDPVSGRSDATFYLRSGKPGKVRAPDAQGGDTTSASPGWLIGDGRTMVALPQLLGSGEVVRGLFGAYRTGRMRVDLASGSSALAFDGLQGQRSNIFGISYGDAQTKAAARVIDVRDDPSTGFFSVEQRAVTTLASLEHHLSRDLDVSADVGVSTVDGLAVGAPAGSDTGDDLLLNFAHARTAISATYTNAGPLFGAVGGAGAAGDQTATALNAQFGLGAHGTLLAGATQTSTRSVFSRVANADLGYVLSLPSSLTIALTGSRASNRSLGASTDADTGSLAISRSWNGASLGLSESLTAMRDLLGGSLNAVIRTTSVQWSEVRGARQFAIGVNAMNNAPLPASGSVPRFGIPMLTGLSNTGATITYGLPLGPPSTFELQSFYAASNSSSAFGHAIDRDFALTLSRHVGPHFALGLRYEYLSHTTGIPITSSASPALRVHLEVTQ